MEHMNTLGSFTAPCLTLSSEMIELIRDAVVITDLDGHILDVNRPYLEITGYTRDELIGERPAKIQSGRHDSVFYRVMWDSLLSRGFWQGEIWDRRKNGEIYPKWLSIRLIKDEAGTPMYYFGIFHDTSAQHQNEAERERLTSYDPLTEIANRTHFREQVVRHMRYCSREHISMCLMVIDLDNFKHINDTLGHTIGDDLLIELARRLHRLTVTDPAFSQKGRYSEVFLGRFGGDEFLVAFEDHFRGIELTHLIERVFQTIRAPIVVNGRSFEISASMGLSHFPADSLEFDDLLRHAESAMYQAKHSGRNRAEFFTPAINEELQRRLHLETTLRTALADGEFELYYQPKMGGIHQQVVGLEALIRWNHPQLGVLSPGDFISIAEETGLIVPIGNWVLNEACRYGASLLQRNAGELVMAVNVSARQFASENWVEQVINALDESGLPPHLLELEITESIVIGNFEHVTDRINDLRALGVKIALDDFGTGYSSLNYLRRLPIDTLKIDRSFIAQLHLAENEGDRAIVCAIVMLAKKLGMTLVAEGVETQGHVDVLAELGCDQLQGYLYSRPVPASEVLARLNEIV